MGQFAFKQFTIEQSANAHKVGTDSMVLGAWTKGNFKKILDVGTGTGILALMQAQNNPEAFITAIEPTTLSCNEAQLNFDYSPFKKRLKTINTSLQAFQSADLFDLIIANPPYFVNSSLSEEVAKNEARHTVNLSILALYENVKRLLATKGQFSVIFPSDLFLNHTKTAANFGLFPKEILILENENGEAIRHAIHFTAHEQKPNQTKMIAKYADGMYSRAYVELTADFHDRVLPFRD